MCNKRKTIDFKAILENYDGIIGTWYMCRLFLWYSIGKMINIKERYGNKYERNNALLYRKE